jgi:hypothetical protein
VRSPYLTLATLAPWASTCSLHTSDHLGRVPRATAAGYCCGLLLRATAAGYLGLPMKIIVTPSREPLVRIHRGFITWC